MYESRKAVRKPFHSRFCVLWRHAVFVVSYGSATWRHNPEELDLNLHRIEILKLRIKKFLHLNNICLRLTYGSWLFVRRKTFETIICWSLKMAEKSLWDIHIYQNPHRDQNRILVTWGLNISNKLFWMIRFYFTECSIETLRTWFIHDLNIVLHNVQCLSNSNFADIVSSVNVLPTTGKTYRRALWHLLLSTRYVRRNERWFFCTRGFERFWWLKSLRATPRGIPQAHSLFPVTLQRF
jgi:hypothetical protein